MECVFCELLAGDGEVSVVAKDELVVAVMDAFPVAEGHVLLIPRRHVSTISELSAPEGAALWAMAQRITVAVKSTFAPAVNLHLADGIEADQDVPHVHMHVLPRRNGDDVTIDLPGAKSSRVELDHAARELSRRSPTPSS